MAASRTVPCSSLTSCGSSSTVAPAPVRLGDAAVDVGHLERDVDDAVAVLAVVVVQRAGRVDAALEHEAHGAALEHVRVVVAVAGRRAGVGDQLHAERRAVEVRGLGGVADDPDDGVPAGDRERVGGGVVLDQPDQLLQLVEAEVGQPLLVGEGLLDRHGRAPLPHLRVVCTSHSCWACCASTTSGLAILEPSADRSEARWNWYERLVRALAVPTCSSTSSTWP